MIIEQLLVAVACIGVLTLIVQLVGSIMYDIKEARNERQIRSAPYSRNLRKRPLFSVLIYNQNGTYGILNCLESVVTNGYRKFEIIVVDAASSDDSRAVVQQFIGSHPKQTIKLMARKTITSHKQALGAGYKTYGHGQLVIALDSDCVLTKHSLQTAVQSFNSNEGMAVAKPQLRVGRGTTVRGLMHEYVSLLTVRPRKARSIFGQLELPGTLGIYTQQAFRSLFVQKSASSNRSQHYKTSYLHDVVVSQQANPSLLLLYRQFMATQRLYVISPLSFRHARLPTRPVSVIWLVSRLAVQLALLTTPFLVSYFVYLSLQLNQPTLLLSSVSIISIVLLIAIWDDSRLKLHQKVAYVFGIPLTFLPLLIILALHGVALLTLTNKIRPADV